MPPVARTALAASALLVLAACAAPEDRLAEPVTADAPAAAVAVPQERFAEALREAYGAMMQFEERAGSAEDAAFFADRLTAARSATLPAPLEAPTPELERARAALDRAMALRDRRPAQVATAQAAYDCWANDTAAGRTPTPVDCRQLLIDTLRDLSATAGG